MHDVEILLEDRPGALAELGEALGAAGISIEGGGVWPGAAHFLFADGHAAKEVLERSAIRAGRVSEVVLQRLAQGEPGQLGKLAREMANAGVNIRVQYSDHGHQLVLVVDELEKARAVSQAWTRHRLARE